MWREFERNFKCNCRQNYVANLCELTHLQIPDFVCKKNKPQTINKINLVC